MSANDSALLNVRDAVVTAGKARLVDGISFLLNAGDVLAVLGANGAGKSTLLAALSGAQRLSAGSIHFAGTSLDALTPAALAERRAVNAVEPPLSFSLTAAEVVALGRPFSPIDDRALLGALSEVHATQWALRNVDTLSSGEYLRVQLARSRYQLGDARNCLWLLDEPCAHLDLTQRQFVLTHLQRIAKVRGWAVIFTTHDPAEAEAIADYVMLMREGKMLNYDSANTVLTQHNLSTCYGNIVVRKHGWVAG
jgi:iron complex transport system ATP-binding protein